MAADKLVQARQRMQALGQAFREGLPGRLHELRAAAAGLAPGASAEQIHAALSAIRMLAHRLAGTAGTYGLLDLGETARRLERLCDRLHDATLTPDTQQCAEALEALLAFQPDVILMDIDMPGFSGLELACVIRQHVEYLQTPIVFITGHAGNDNRLDAWRSGGDDFIAKPVRPEILIPSLRARAEKSRALVSLAVHQKVKASRERFHALASVSPVATLYADPDGLCLFVNARFTSMTGADADSALGKHWTHWVHPDDRPRVMAAWVASVEGGQGLEAEFRLAAEAEPQWVIGRTSAQVGEDGEVAGYAATLTDITEIKRTGEALADAKQMLETTFASIHDAVLVADADSSRIFQCNAAVEPILGYRNEEIEGISLAELFSDGAEYRRYEMRKRAELGYGGMIHAFKNFILRANFDYLTAAREKLSKAEELLQKFERQELTGGEIEQLKVVRSALERYREVFTVAENMVREGVALEEIDAAVRVDDGLALRAMELLLHENVANGERDAAGVYTALAVTRTLAATNLVIALTMTVLLIGIAWWLIRWRIVTPILRITDTMDSLAAGRLETPIPEADQHNEIGQMAAALQVFEANARGQGKRRAIVYWPGARHHRAQASGSYEKRVRLHRQP